MLLRIQDFDFAQISPQFYPNLINFNSKIFTRECTTLFLCLYVVKKAYSTAKCSIQLKVSFSPNWFSTPRSCQGLGTRLFVKVLRPGESEVTFRFSLPPVTTSLTTQRSR